MWLEESLTIKCNKGDSVTMSVGESILKVDIPRKLLFKFCKDGINCGKVEFQT